MSTIEDAARPTVDGAGTLASEPAKKPNMPACGEAALGTSQLTFTPPGLEDARRGARLRRRQRSSAWLIADTRLRAGLSADAPEGTRAGDVEWLRPPRPARCKWRVAGAVGVHGSPGGSAYFSGIEKCASIWSCPCCSAVIRRRRSKEIVAAVKAHSANNGTLLFLTLTLRHHHFDSLRTMLRAAGTGWSNLISGTAWKRQAARFGVQGYIRATEVTLGVGSASNGWHPHLHVLLFMDAPVGDQDLHDFRQWLSTRWAKKVTELGARTPSRDRGVVLQRVDDGEILASYLSKVQEKQLGAELARSDLKQGRGQSINPFDLLDRPLADYASRRLWVEYTEATYRQKAITWSRSLRSDLGIDHEKTDEELLEDSLEHPHLMSIDASTYDAKMNDYTWLNIILGTAERAKAEERLPKVVNSVRVENTYIDERSGEIVYSADNGSEAPEILDSEGLK